MRKAKVPTVRDAVDLGVQRLDNIPASEPELKAELQVTLGTIYYQLGLLKQAQEMHAQAVVALKIHSPDPLLTIYSRALRRPSKPHRSATIPMRK